MTRANLYCTARTGEEMEKGDAKKVVLLWASRTMKDTFWENRIAAATAKYGEDKFVVRYLLSREEAKVEGGGALKGRVTPEVFQDVFDGAWAKLLYLRR